MFLPFLVKPPPKDSKYEDSSSSVVVPCVRKGFPAAMTNYSHLTITVAPRHKVRCTVARKFVRATGFRHEILHAEFLNFIDAPSGG